MTASLIACALDLHQAAEHRECRESMRELELMVQSAAIKPSDQYPGAPQQPLPPPLVV